MAQSKKKNVGQASQTEKDKTITAGLSRLRALLDEETSPHHENKVTTPSEAIITHGYSGLNAVNFTEEITIACDLYPTASPPQAPKSARKRKGKAKANGAKWNPVKVDDTPAVQPWEKAPSPSLNTGKCRSIQKNFQCGCKCITHAEHNINCNNVGEMSLCDGGFDMVTRKVDTNCTNCTARDAMKKMEKIDRRVFRRENE